MRRVEARPEPASLPERPIDENWEMSLAGALVNTVDMLFTYRPIAEKLQGMEENEHVQAFLRHRKQSITHRLEETAWLEVYNFLADLEEFRAGQETASSPSSRPIFKSDPPPL